MHWFARRSSGVYTAEACARLRTADVGYSPNRARSVRFCGGAVVGAADRNRNHDRQSRAPVFAVDGLWGAGLGPSASVASASITSPGEVLSSRTPSGRPSPSTSTIHLVPLPRLVFPTAAPPFSLGRSCRRERPRPISTVTFGAALTSNVCHAFSHTPSSSHCLSCRQQVEGEGNLSGRNRHAAPVWRIHKMPSKQARLEAGGRPRRSGRCLSGGSKAPTTSYCSSVNGFCRSFMTAAQP